MALPQATAGSRCLLALPPLHHALQGRCFWAWSHAAELNAVARAQTQGAVEVHRVAGRSARQGQQANPVIDTT
eukprot:scaffold14219_cov24-Tisochrysis_lutea.AAC.1